MLADQSRSIFPIHNVKGTYNNVFRLFDALVGERPGYNEKDRIAMLINCGTVSMEHHTRGCYSLETFKQTSLEML